MSKTKKAKCKFYQLKLLMKINKKLIRANVAMGAAVRCLVLTNQQLTGKVSELLDYLEDDGGEIKTLDGDAAVQMLQSLADIAKGKLHDHEDVKAELLGNKKPNTKKSRRPA